MSNLFMQYIDNIKILNLNTYDYLIESIDNHKTDSLCIGWEYLKTNLTPDLKNILLSEEYNKCFYNEQMVNHIINKLNIEDLSSKLKKQLSSFVYVWKSLKRDFEQKEKENNLKLEMLNKGFVEQILNPEQYKMLHLKKVICVLDISAKEIQGTFVYNEHNQVLYIMPKRHRTTGLPICNKFYYKSLEERK